MRDFSNSTMIVTGGAGFIGSNFIRHILSVPSFQGRIVNIDALTYAGNPRNLAAVQCDRRYSFYHADIRDFDQLREIFRSVMPAVVVHFAAESHVDRSIVGPKDFVETNIVGTFNLLEVSRWLWADRTDVLFHHVSTDEVYGTLGPDGYFSEDSPYDPRSPYSATKAASDHLVRSYFHTFGIPITVSNCSNNYGAYQFPEKLIPHMILNMLEGKPLPIYGDGGNVRDWLHVSDHSEAIRLILHLGQPGETYNIGGDNELRNVDLVKHLCEEVARQCNIAPTSLLSLIEFVPDRPGHDKRYAIDCSKIKRELGWAHRHSFEDGLRDTISWYISHPEWVESIRTGEYRRWIDANYSNRVLSPAAIGRKRSESGLNEA